jgi:flagellar protein FlaG
MSNTAPISGSGPDVVATPSVTPAPATSNQGTTQAPPTPLDEQSDLRLVIEDDKAAGCYVYKTINPRTGEVVFQVPREQLLRMREADDYQPGSVINARS